jgi:ankyrin repeat protein
MNTTDLRPLPSHPSLEQYRKQAKDFVKACKTGDPESLWQVRKYHPRYLLPRNLVEAAKLRSGQLLESEVDTASFTLADAQLVIARTYGFESWPKFTKHLQGLERKDSPISTFERAADAIVTGDRAMLERLLGENQYLIRARSARAHRAMLLHYIAANGFERFRQKTPKNILEIAQILLNSGADVNAVADTYGKGTTLGLVATSAHPKRAGVQIPLLELLLDHGADINGLEGTWSPVLAALKNGCPEAAEFLARRGAKLDLASAGGLGRLELIKSFFDANRATKEDIDSGFTLACLYGWTSVVEFLVEMGADLRAEENTGQTGLHCAVIGGHTDLIELLLERGAPLEALNVHGGTVLGQALWCVINGSAEADYISIIDTLLAAGARIEEGTLAWLAEQDSLSSPKRAHLAGVLRRYGASD